MFHLNWHELLVFRSCQLDLFGYFFWTKLDKTCALNPAVEIPTETHQKVDLKFKSIWRLDPRHRRAQLALSLMMDVFYYFWICFFLKWIRSQSIYLHTYAYNRLLKTGKPGHSIPKQCLTFDVVWSASLLKKDERWAEGTTPNTNRKWLE